MQLQIPCGHRMQELKEPDSQKEIHMDHASNVQEATGTPLY